MRLRASKWRDIAQYMECLTEWSAKYLSKSFGTGSKNKIDTLICPELTGKMTILTYSSLQLSHSLFLFVRVFVCEKAFLISFTFLQLSLKLIYAHFEIILIILIIILIDIINIISFGYLQQMTQHISLKSRAGGMIIGANFIVYFIRSVEVYS